MTQITPNKKNRALRAAVIATVAGALALPMITQHLRAEDAKDKAAAPKPDAKPAAAAAAASKPDAGKVVASAGDVQVTSGEFDQFLSQLQPQRQAMVVRDGEARKELAQQILTVKALAREAERRKLQDDEKFKEQLEMIRMQVLAQTLITSLSTGEESDKQYFESHKDQFGKLQARHILISTQGPADPKNPKPTLSDADAKKKAEDVRARLVKGEDFAALAKKESDDPGSKDTGGEYTFDRGQFVPPFEKAAYALKENEISEPVKSPFGYHVIQLMKRLPVTFDEARQHIPGQRVEALFNESTGGGKITFDPSLSETAPVAPVPAPAPAPAKGAK